MDAANGNGTQLTHYVITNLYITIYRSSSGEHALHQRSERRQLADGNKTTSILYTGKLTVTFVVVFSTNFTGSLCIVVYYMYEVDQKCQDFRESINLLW